MLDIVTDVISGVLDVGTNVMEEASEAKLLESSMFHGSLGGFHTVFLGKGFACGVGVASSGTVPSFTGSPFKVWSNLMCDMLDIVSDGVSGMMDP